MPHDSIGRVVDAGGAPVADTILGALRPITPDGLTRTEISGLLGRHKDTDAITLALADLAKRGLVRCKREETGGRPVERWFAI